MKEASTAKPNDVFDLNVGGQKLSVSRQTLTCTPGSMLESLFSGRWDAGLAKDKDGCFFIDQPFELFEAMINCLRAKFLELPGSKVTRLSPDFKDHPAKQQHFRDMVEYYGMTGTIFPAKLNVYCGPEVNVNMMDDLEVKVESTSSTMPLTTFNIIPKGHEREICSFQITLEKVDSIRVGWIMSKAGFIRNSVGCISNSVEDTEGVGAKEGTVALSYFPCEVDVKLDGVDSGKVPNDSVFRTVEMRCEDFGNRWYVDGKLVLSTDPNDGEGTMAMQSRMRGEHYCFGNKWYVDGNLVLSTDLNDSVDTNDSVNLLGLRKNLTSSGYQFADPNWSGMPTQRKRVRVPTITAKGAFYVSDVVYSED